MKTRNLRLAIALMAVVPGIAAAQHEGHQAAPPQSGGADMTQCAQAQPVVSTIIAAAMARLETARQSNSPAAMRSAIDDLQGALRDVRAQLVPCGALQPSADPHAVSAMATVQHAPSAQPDKPAMQPSSTTSAPEAKILEWLKGYDAAPVAKDLDRLGTFYHPDVTVVEGTGVNNGWADYRDHHLGPELKEFEGLEFAHGNMSVHMLGDRSAYVTSQYAIKAKMKERALDAEGRETLVLAKMPDNTWKIRHSHTSSRPRRP